MIKTCSLCDNEYENGFKARKTINLGTGSVCRDCMPKVNKSKLKDYHKSKAIFKKYGITMADYYDMMRLQGGVCKICNLPARKNSRLAIDHCHKTGAVRGLLCTKCNAVLGLAGDNEEILRNAIKYLEHTKNFTLRSSPWRDLDLDSTALGARQ